MILSVSRRTDIPAFYSDWFLRRLQEGYCLVRNPMNPRQISRIALSPKVVDCIVFWTKNPAPLLQKLPEIRRMGYEFYFQFTLTPYGRDLEQNLPAKNVLLSTFRKLGQLIGPERVVWRYDPIVVNEAYPPDWHARRFNEYAHSLRGYTDTCVISFVDLYAKTLRNSRGKIFSAVSPSDMESLVVSFVQSGTETGIQVKSCAEQTDFSALGVTRSACIDRERIEKLLGCHLTVRKDKNQRPVCGCVESVDIGEYESCEHGCVYCYASSNPARVRQNHVLHDPASPLLIGRSTDNSRIISRAMFSQKDSQTILF